MTIDLDTISAFLRDATIGFDTDDSGTITLEDDDGNVLTIFWDGTMPDNRGWAYRGPYASGAIDDDADLIEAIRDGLGRSYPTLGDSITIDGDEHTVSSSGGVPRLMGPGGEVLHLTQPGVAGLLMAEDPARFMRRAARRRTLGVWHD